MTLRLRPLYVICALTIIGAVSYGARQATWEAGLAELRIKGGERLALHREGLQAAVERYRYLPFLLAQDSGIRGMLKNPGDPLLRDEANRYLERASSASGADALYVMDAEGLTLAASNYAQETSFVGHSYSFRPYFNDALKKGEGRFYAIGVTTRQPGYFLSHVIREEGKVLGVAVVKLDLRPLENSWRAAGDMVAMLDRSEIAFLASVDDWVYRPLQPLSDATLMELRASRQYGEADLRSPSLIPEKGTGGEGALISIRRRDGNQRTPAVLFHRLGLPDHGWTLIGASDVTSLRERANLVAVTTALALALVGLIGLVLRQRRQLIRAKLDAHDILELRVQERTRELRQLNEELACQIGVRERAEEELRRAQGELIQAAKLAALGQMSAAIVHEVSQPLTAIETYIASTRLLLQRGSAEIVAENMKIIGDLVGRMRHMAKSLKAFARKEEVGAETIDLRNAVQNATSVLRPRLEAGGVELVVEIPGSDTFVTMHCIRAEQVLVNLIGNAIDAVRSSEERTIHVRLASDADGVTLTVADSGPGIPEPLKAHLAEPFVTSKGAGEGLGLGLFICDTIINDAGGKLTFGNRADGGAVFTVRLPRSAEQPRWAAE
jgi:two-component system C4-dicarboxylate transport sensor histidine kinase DctB